MNAKSIQRIVSSDFGSLSDGSKATLFTLKNSQQTEINITNYGAIIVSLFTADNQGQLADIVLGYDNVQDYEQDTYYLGAVIGRYAGRINQGRISIDGKNYQLELNAPTSQLHGGKKGLNKQLWHAQTNQTSSSATLTLTYTSPDGEQGFPGKVNFKVIYTLTDNNELIVEYFADTDKPTIVNLTQHSYYNLAGHQHGNINEHQVQLNADYFLPMSEQVYPTGEIAGVANSLHDFTTPQPLGKHINNTDDKQISIAKGFDNYWLANADAIHQQNFIAQVSEPTSGRRLTLYSDQPSIILYTANYIDGSHIGKEQTQYQARAALCLEPVRAVTKDYINDLKPVTLRPESPFYSKSCYKFDLA